MNGMGWDGMGQPSVADMIPHLLECLPVHGAPELTERASEESGVRLFHHGTPSQLPPSSGLQAPREKHLDASP